MSGVRLQIPDVRYQMSDVRCQISDVRCQISDVRCQMLPLSQFTSCSAGPLPRAKLWFIQKPSDPSPSQHLHLVIRALSCFHWLQNTLFVATNSGQFVSIHCINTTLTFCGHKQRSVYPNLLFNTALITYCHKQFVWTNDKINQCSGEGGEHPKQLK